MHCPPKLFLRFFRWFCHRKMVDYIEGDLMEVYERRIKQSGKRKADLRFIIDVLLLFRPGIIRPAGGYKNLNVYRMYKSYFKIAGRNLVRNQGYSFVNIGGLAIGMTVAILIGLWIFDELSFNKYYQHYESIGQVWAGGTNPETSAIEGNISVQFPAAATLRNNYGHYFKHVLTAWWITDYTLSVSDNSFIRTGEFIDGGILDMLSLKMIKGSHLSLSDPHSIVLSKSTAESIFGDEDPMNKMLKIDNRIDVQVTGVYEDIPRNNHFSEVDFFSPWPLWVSSNNWIKHAEDNWDNRSFNIYVQLQPRVTTEEVNAAIHDFYYENSPEQFLDEFKKYKSFAQVIPMSSWHLYTEFENGKPAGGRITFVWLFGIVGVFVLFLACINFINLSTARSEKRARETGIRKAVGSVRAQLVGQFLTESFLMACVAFLLSAILLLLSLSWFNEIADKDIRVPIDSPIFWGVIVALLLITSFMAGLYPAFYLSSFQPVKVLKGTFRPGRLAALPRKILVVVQFTVSVVLIVGTIVVYRQIQHARNRPIGYNRENLISIRMTDPSFNSKYEVVRNELFNTGFVEETAFSDNPLTMAWNNYGGFDWKGKDPDKDSDFTVCYVSDTYGQTVNWQLVEGRDFNKFLASDSSAIIINESAARYMNLEDPVGKYLTDGAGAKLQIIGVAKDLIMNSPYEPVKQTIFTWNRYASSNILIKIKETAPAAEAVAGIEKVFQRIVPTAGFDYKFVDDEYAKKFSQEERIGKLAGTFTILAVFISVLGLFGLASFVAEQRTKEIGIRKVVGASVFNVWTMLSKDFVVLVIISCTIAVPTAWYFMGAWLTKYQYRTEISWWIILASCLGTVFITLLTVSYQAIRAATMNPVTSLRSE
ncbi:MAG TPA: ABC transporter permease [Cyclobacteriaceae bacterium]|nr:ABC transporter permease [Cyclobacteriaceae bacterium]